MAALPEDITGWQVLVRTSLKFAPDPAGSGLTPPASRVTVAVEYSVDGGQSWHPYDPDGGIILADDVPDDAPPAGP